MTRRRFGLAFQTDKAIGEYGRLAALAESIGFDVVSVYADLGFQPPLPALLEMAHATSRVGLGPACLNPFTMHPYEIAGFVAALDAASRGRAYLGLARGAWLGSIGIDQRGAVSRVEETWEIVARLLAGDRSGFEGAHFRLVPGFGLATTPRRPSVPLLIGGWGPQMLSMAGRLGAREVKIGGSAAPDVVAEARRRIGNDEVGIVVGAVTVVDEDGSVARALARREVAMYVDVVADLDPHVEIDPDALAGIRHAVAEGDHEGAGRFISDELLDRYAFSGTPEHVVRQAGAVLAAGASRVEFGTPHGTDVGRAIELLGSVMSALR